MYQIGDTKTVGSTLGGEIHKHPWACNPDDHVSSKGSLLLRLVPEPSDQLFTYVATKFSYFSWGIARNLAKWTYGGRLPTKLEISEWLKGKPKIDLTGRDTWVPCFVDEKMNSADWVQIGDSRFNESHVTKHGFPAWGSNPDDNSAYKGTLLIRWASEVGFENVGKVKRTEKKLSRPRPHPGGTDSQTDHDEILLEYLSNGMVRRTVVTVTTTVRPIYGIVRGNPLVSFVNP
eukprot:TRINITY_DN4909_c0_g3_i6.p1 TRINITY_DN4909_c0_g3~~TRINITY_DN4909_c0_g3_i6.p1  ORF type:complete len:232 (-),score=38.97 TRINITY_DN4909_c0_g3_i6:583-1278(-)